MADTMPGAIAQGEDALMIDVLDTIVDPIQETNTSPGPEPAADHIVVGPPANETYSIEPDGNLTDDAASTLFVPYERKDSEPVHVIDLKDEGVLEDEKGSEDEEGRIDVDDREDAKSLGHEEDFKDIEAHEELKDLKDVGGPEGLEDLEGLEDMPDLEDVEDLEGLEDGPDLEDVENLGPDLFAPTTRNATGLSTEARQSMRSLLQSRLAESPATFSGVSIKVEIPDDAEVIDLTADDVPMSNVEGINAHDISKSTPEKAGKKRKRKEGRSSGIKLTKAFRESRKAQLDAYKVARPSFFADIAKNYNLESQREFAAGNKREKVWEEIRKGHDFASKDEERAFEADLRLLKDALKDLGAPRIKPGHKGTWRMPGLASTLRHHQLLGLAFMVKRETSGEAPFGGIMADQMGLGKTVMALSLMVRGSEHRLLTASTSPLQSCKTTLVVCPSSIVNQWYDEIAVHCFAKADDDTSQPKFKAIIKTRLKYKDPSEDTDTENALNTLANNDVIIATYHQVSRSWPKVDVPLEITDPYEKQDYIDREREETKGLLHKMKFHRIILDEGHLIRNPDTAVSTACRALSGDFRWVLSGTPMTNGAADLWALYDFVGQPMPVESYESFKASMGRAPDGDKDLLFNQILNFCMIQRTHADIFLNAKLVTLPPSEDAVFECTFNAIETAVYAIVQRRFLSRIKDIIQSGVRIHGNTHIFTMMTRLRQLTGHPLVVLRTLGDLLEQSDFIELNEVFETWEVEGRTRELGRCLLRQIKTALEHDATCIEEDGRPKRNQKKNGAKGAAQLLRNLDTGSGSGLASALICVVCGETAVDAQRTSCGHIYCAMCLDTVQEDSAVDKAEHTRCIATGCEQRFSFVDPASASSKIQKRASAEDLTEDETALFEEEGALMSSAKMLAINQQIHKWLAQSPKNKVIVFTQWACMISMVSSMCNAAGWNHLTFTGSMSMKARSKATADFAKDPKIKVLISGLKVGSLGLNLTMASKVICVDPWYNNAVEQQAFARVHRIGQTLPTSYLQLVVRNTIDMRLQSIKSRKQLEIDNYNGMRQMKTEEMLSLFGKVTKVNGRFVVEEYPEDYDDTVEVSGEARDDGSASGDEEGDGEDE